MLYYIGRFPAPYGGVTIKNALLYKIINDEIYIKKLDTNNVKITNIIECINFFRALLNPQNHFVVGVSGSWRNRISRFLYLFNKTALKNSILIVMGGQYSNYVVNNPDTHNWIKCYKKVYVETHSMKNTLNSVGLRNISVFPNCRVRPTVRPNIDVDNGRLKCVFFSMINPKKGTEDVLLAAKALPEIDFDFWGDIADEYKDTFKKAVSQLSNCHYKGTFKSNSGDVYGLLSSYDAMLFPTKWKIEGVPGTLVEAKMAGIPSVVSDISYNSEIIEDMVDGIVLKQNDAVNLINAINLLDKNRSLLKKLKIGALSSSVKYDIECYKKEIVGELK